MLADPFLIAPGDLIDDSNLEVPLAQELLRFIRSGFNPYVNLVELRRTDDCDILVLDLCVEVPRLPKFDIRGQERVAIRCFHTDDRIPEVLALRESFPLVPHLSLRDEEIPRSLCLYDEPFETLKLRRLTGAAILNRILDWLKLTARGELHAPDQPLEPLLPAGLGILVLDEAVTEVDAHPAQLDIIGIWDRSRRPTLIAKSVGVDHTQHGRIEAVAAVVSTRPLEHGVIRRTPRTLLDLHRLLEDGGVDLIHELRERIRGWHGNQEVYDRHLVVICVLPKVRHPGGPIEAREVRAFFAPANIKEIGRELGVWDWQGNGAPGLILAQRGSQDGANLEVAMLDPVYSLDREQAATLNGLPSANKVAITAVGAGALGSQVIMNLVRAGYGTWALIDDDQLLPHNVARHALPGDFVGLPKADGIARLTSSSITGPEMLKAIVADVMRPGGQATEVRTALSTAQVILDLSASVPVARFLARDIDSRARRLSLFLSPTGNDLVVLVEDRARSVPLDHLEMQYYQWLLEEGGLADHLRIAGRVRYGITCRDVTSVLSQDVAALHAAISSRTIKDALSGDRALIRVFRFDKATLTVRVLEYQPTSMHERAFGDWMVIATDRVEDSIGKLRRQALPNETGGTLVGVYDLARKIVYVADILPSPPGSVCYPNLYIRGCTGLIEKYERVHRLTAGMLEYVGEWHTHPQGHGCEPSQDDRTFFSWLTRLLGADGLPPLMVIAAAEGRFCWYLNAL